MYQNEQRKTDKGFTLVELMLVVVIIGLLAGVAVPNLMGRLKEAKRAKAQADINVLENAIDMYAMHIGDYPTSEEGLKVLVTNVGNQDEIPPREGFFRERRRREIQHLPAGDAFRVQDLDQV